MAAVIEVPFVAFLPNFIVQHVVLRRLRLQTGGTILVCGNDLMSFFFMVLSAKYIWSLFENLCHLLL